MSPSKILYAVFSKFWNIPVPEQGELFGRLGFDGLELPVRPGYQVEPENIGTALPEAAAELADHGMRIYSIAIRPGRPDERTIAACAEAGVPVIRDMIRVRPDESYLEVETRTRKEFEALAPILDGHGVKLGVQNHSGRFVANAAGLRRILEPFDPAHIGAVYDPGHCSLDGEHPEIAIDLLWSHLLHVNLKNMLWRRKNSPDAEVAEWKSYVTSGREGLASWPGVVKELKRRGYEGVVNICAEFSDREAKDRLLVEDLAFAKSLFGAA
jgi:sugar phosphate isomerase/epimerase